MAPYRNSRSASSSSQQAQDERSHKDNLSGSRLSTQVKDAKPNQNKSSSSRPRSKSSPLIEIEQPYKKVSSLQVEDRQPCYLLKAHPEIRNEIYRLVLVSEDPIEVGASDAPPMDPPFLRTCSLIRFEARGIFYKENTVKFTVVDYNIRRIVRWFDLSPSHHDLCTKIHVQLSVSHKWVYCWSALLNWAYAYRQGRCGRLTLDSSSVAPNNAHATESDRIQAVSLFDIADRHLKSHVDDFRGALDQYHMSSMRGTNSIWWDHPTPLDPYYYRYSLGPAPSSSDPFGLRAGPVFPSPSTLSISRNEITPSYPAFPHPALRFYKGSYFDPPLVQYGHPSSYPPLQTHPARQDRH
jgi:hypothetical protein